MSTPLHRYDTIEGLTPRDPVGAVLTIGTKAPKGNPTETDRFFFKAPDAAKEGEHLVKPLHPGFASYNAAPADKRRVILGNLVHATQAEAFHYSLSAQVLGAPWKHYPGAHPNRLPICSGDGSKATRLYGIDANGAEDWRQIDCPNELCQFRQGKTKPCKPSMRFLFRPRWKDGSGLPTPLTLLSSHSWHSTARLLGFFKYVEAQARQLGLAEFSLYGLPFVLTLAMKTKPTEQSRFPVLSIAPDADLIAFFLAQREQLARIGAGEARAALPASLTDPAMNDPVRVAQDFAECEPGHVHVLSKPSNAETAEPLDAEVIEDDAQDPDEESSDGRLSVAAVRRIESAARSKGLSEQQVYSIAGGRLEDAPSSAELEILRGINSFVPRKGGK